VKLGVPNDATGISVLPFEVDDRHAHAFGGE